MPGSGFLMLKSGRFGFLLSGSGFLMPGSGFLMLKSGISPISDIQDSINFSAAERGGDVRWEGREGQSVNFLLASLFFLLFFFKFIFL